ncbi:unnamed protein product [Phytophthora lilii]|uniref:Unnamed protein product n=1 Tax=Phytophthora lilii TaxID=2077276 RepID=A0A9W6TRU4_9STRA|nr:unnamed protein product [Phytophthora lilii]
MNCFVQWTTWRKAPFGRLVPEMNDFVPVTELCSCSRNRTWDLFATESGADATAVSTEAISNARLNSKGFVLDIDLDYFSTWDPFWKGMYMKLQPWRVTLSNQFTCIFRPGSPNCERKAFCKLIERLKVADAHEDDAKRKLEWTQIANDLTLQYAEGVNAEENLLNFAKLLEKYRDDKAIRSEIWAAGPYLNLPHHESSQEEIARMVAELEQFLHTNALDVTNPPAIVTIAKSTGDQYLPPHQLDVVLSSVLQMLERVYGKLATKFVEYEPVEDAGTKREM